jgi:hypothetical protein
MRWTVQELGEALELFPNEGRAAAGGGSGILLRDVCENPKTHFLKFAREAISLMKMYRLWRSIRPFCTKLAAFHCFTAATCHPAFLELMYYLELQDLGLDARHRAETKQDSRANPTSCQGGMNMVGCRNVLLLGRLNCVDQGRSKASTRTSVKQCDLPRIVQAGARDNDHNVIFM